MQTTHHPHHTQQTKRAARELNLDLNAPTRTITDRPTLRLDLTTKTSGLKILSATLKPHPNPNYRKHAAALLRHDHRHIAEAATRYGAQIIILATHQSLPPHDALSPYAKIRLKRPLQLHHFPTHAPEAQAA